MAGAGDAVKLNRLLNGLAYAWRTFALRSQSPYLLGLVITDRCNLSCFYCESKNRGECHFTREQAEELLVEAYARGHRTLYFTGGEPMLWRDGHYLLSDLVQYARRLGFFDVFVFTNGTLPLDIAGCSYIVTVDGPKRIHNEIRTNSWDTIISNVRNSGTHAVFASITLTRENCTYLREFVEEICSLGIFRGISFNLLTHWPEMVAKFGVTGEQRTRLLDELWQMKKEGYPIVLSRAAYHALRRNDWKRPIPQIELATSKRLFTCCRDVDNPSICENCGYANCVEVSQLLALKPSAVLQVLRMVR